jgi:hypothetical protein
MKDGKGGLAVHLAHILFSGPLLIYVGFMKPQYQWVYYMLLCLGVVLILYFLWEMIEHLPLSQKHVWLLIHAVIFGGLLVYVGLRGIHTPDVVYSILLAIGIAAVGYHTVRMVQDVS